MNNRKWYFTFGNSPTQPFCGGWVVVIAETEEAAIAKFNAWCPTNNGLINCAMIYCEREFKRTNMYLWGNNLGAGCHRIIT